MWKYLFALYEGNSHHLTWFCISSIRNFVSSYAIRFQASWLFGRHYYWQWTISHLTNLKAFSHTLEISYKLFLRYHSVNENQNQSQRNNKTIEQYLYCFINYEHEAWFNLMHFWSLLLFYYIHSIIYKYNSTSQWNILTLFTHLIARSLF